MTEFPPIFAPFLEEIRATARPSVRFNLSNGASELTASKVGGRPYWPAALAYPSNPAGQPLCLLAQINLAEMPALPDFPRAGLLQFFIDGYDDEMGVCYDDLCNQAKFRVIYHREINEPLAEPPPFTPPPADGLPFPFGREYRMNFLPVEDHHLTQADYRFSQQLPNLSRFLEGSKWQNLENYERANGEESHRIGGYPFFTQDDPRHPAEDRMPVGYELLFQLVSHWDEDEETELMWGDVGVGNFFIHPADLRKCDFSRVGYSMDCC